jgi:thioredoxin 1
MTKRNTANALIVVGVLVFVLGVAWYRESHRDPVESMIQRVPGLPMVLDLGGETCPDCKVMAPVLDELEREYAGRAVIQFIDVFKHGHVGEHFEVSITPTQIFFDRDGLEVGRHEGGMTKPELVAKLKELGVK